MSSNWMLRAVGREVGFSSPITAWLAFLSLQRAQMDNIRYTCEQVVRFLSDRDCMAGTTHNTAASAIEIFRRHGGTMRTGEALAEGIHPRTLYALRDTGLLEQVSRGVYRLANEEPVSDPDLLTVAARIPKGVVCLISALALHHLTTQIPHAVDIAIPPGAWTPTISHPPIRVFRFGGKSMTEGVDIQNTGGVELRVFNQEKTIADCFKFRNKIGLDVAVEALRTYMRSRRANVDTIMRYAEIDRVATVMRPYLEAVL